MKIKWIENGFLLLLGFLLAGYTFYKGFHTSFTHDESYTYLNYVHIPVSDIINYTNCPDIPNNHILNTLLMKFFEVFFGYSEFALRLPNLLAHLTFIIFSILWLKKFKNTILILTGFIVLHVNVYLLDFFSLARGYGLSICLMFVSLYYFHMLIRFLKPKYVWFTFFFGALAVWSNFTVLNYYVSLSGVFFIFLFAKSISEELTIQQKTKKIILQSIPALAISLIIILLITVPIKTIKGNLFGPESGFYQDTMRSLVFSSFRFDSASLNLVTKTCLFILLIFFVSLFCYLFDLVKNRFLLAKSPHMLLLLLLFFSALSTMFQHSFFKTQYLANRTGLFYIVLFNSSYVYLYHFLLDRIKMKSGLHIFFGLYPVFLLIMFAYNFNLHGYLDWKYDSSNKEMLIRLEEEYQHSAFNNKKIGLGVTWLFEPSLNYYRTTKNLYWLNTLTRDGYNGKYDYYYIYNDTSFIHANHKIIIEEFPQAESILAKD